MAAVEALPSPLHVDPRRLTDLLGPPTPLETKIERLFTLAHHDEAIGAGEGESHRPGPTPGDRHRLPKLATRSPEARRRGPLDSEVHIIPNGHRLHDAIAAKRGDLQRDRVTTDGDGRRILPDGITSHPRRNRSEDVTCDAGDHRLHRAAGLTRRGTHPGAAGGAGRVGQRHREPHARHGHKRTDTRPRRKARELPIPPSRRAIRPGEGRHG